MHSAHMYVTAETFGYEIFTILFCSFLIQYSLKLIDKYIMYYLELTKV